METYYWYSNCSCCNQGRLIVTENITENKLYLHCEECEMGWRNPKESGDPNKAFLTLTEDFETTNPDFNKICKEGWTEYAKHTFEE